MLDVQSEVALAHTSVYIFGEVSTNYILTDEMVIETAKKSN